MEFTDSSGNKYILPKGANVGVRISVYPIVLNNKRELLLYMPHYNKQWQLPGGGFDESVDKDIEDTAIRECLEETGYTIRLISDDPIYMNQQNFYKRGDQKYYFAEHIFLLAELVSEIPVGVSEEDKDGIVSWINLEELNEKNTHPIIHDVINILKKL